MSASPPAASADRIRRCQLLAIEGRALEEVGELRRGSSRRRGRAARPTGGSTSSVSITRARTRPPPRAARASRKPSGCSCSSARCASRPAVRARIGTAFTAAAGKPRSSSTAAIGMETFIVSGLPHTSATASRKRARERDVRPAHAALVRELEDPLGARVERLVHRMAEARAPCRRRRGSRATISRRLATRRHAPPRAAARTPRTCRGRPGRRRGSPPRPRPAAIPGRRRASSARRRWSASSRARRSRRAAGRGRSAAPRSARAPVSSRWKYSVKLSLPIRSPVRSRPRTSTRSG